MKTIMHSCQIPAFLKSLPEIRVIPLPNPLVFSGIEEIPDLLFLDLKKQESLDLTAAIRESLTQDQLPIFVCSNQYSLKKQNLFIALGGNGILRTDQEIKACISSIKKDKELFKDTLFPIKSDISTRENSRRLLEILRTMTVKSKTAEVTGKSNSLEETIETLLTLLKEIASYHLGIVILNNNQNVETYVLPDKAIFHADYHDFLNFCLNDFYTHFQNLNMENRKEKFFLGGRDDFNKLSIGSRKLSSYLCFPLKDSGGETAGTLHLGHYNNNFFSGSLTETLACQIKLMESPLAFALKNHQNSIRKDKIFNIFSRFVPREIIPNLVEQESNRSNLSVDKRKIAVLFSDIRSFTTLTEQNGAQTIVDFLNRHFEAMVSEIKKEGGTIDKFIGDAIVALFGVPESFEDNTARAVRASVKMIKKLSSLDTSGLVLPECGYSIGIGIHDGEAIIGNIGSMEKSNYTAIGDVIGIAEDLEGLTKHYGKKILVSASAFSSSKNEVEWEIVVKPGSDQNFPNGLYTPRLTSSNTNGGDGG